jgi:hypothetical protein
MISAMLSNKALVSILSGPTPWPLIDLAILTKTELPVPTNMMIAAKAMPSATMSLLAELR